MQVRPTAVVLDKTRQSFLFSLYSCVLLAFLVFNIASIACVVCCLPFTADITSGSLLFMKKPGQDVIFIISCTVLVQRVRCCSVLCSRSDNWNGRASRRCVPVPDSVACTSQTRCYDRIY
ncbi:hypothetical protein BD626DRAFT_494672 [Schizophyllum amplum]|uniref:Uncharacterized protein n=1 Tax=Schizophyllum amplum TaxID=97359 RepID=A0A550CFK3_9AGAR|nr:hypothetical protein BD626DRAFT_494672 [Auriculariopsis ampla]